MQESRFPNNFAISPERQEQMEAWTEMEGERRLHCCRGVYRVLVRCGSPSSPDGIGGASPSWTTSGVIRGLNSVDSTRGGMTRGPRCPASSVVMPCACAAPRHRHVSKLAAHIAAFLQRCVMMCLGASTVSSGSVYLFVILKRIGTWNSSSLRSFHVEQLEPS
jgi:hypothetical protein